MTRPVTRRREAQSGGFLLRRVTALLGILAVLIAAASVIPIHQAAADPAGVTSCSAAAHEGCAAHAVDRTCSIHIGCMSAAVAAAASSEGNGFGQHWAAATLSPIAGWTGFPAKPPPISLA